MTSWKPTSGPCARRQTPSPSSARGRSAGSRSGDFKVTHYEEEGTTGEEIATADALRELVGTSLAFCGVR